MKSSEEIYKALAEPFAASDVDWRVQQSNGDKTRGLVVAYIDSRAIQARLDTVVGPYNWNTEYRPWHTLDGKSSQLCGLAVYCEDRNEWIRKWDGAENTDIEPVKGGISDSFKRAAVMWGIGRYLYNIDAIWVDVEAKGKSLIITEDGKARLRGIYEKAVNAPAGKTIAFPNNRAPNDKPDFDYAVRTVQQRTFASGTGMVLQLKSADGKSIEAFLQKADKNLAEGVCLKNVRLNPFESEGYRSYTMDSYEVA